MLPNGEVIPYSHFFTPSLSVKDLLKEVIEKNWSVTDKPELFCFGLLETFDIPQLEALANPRTITKR